MTVSMAAGGAFAAFLEFFLFDQPSAAWAFSTRYILLLEEIDFFFFSALASLSFASATFGAAITAFDNAVMASLVGAISLLFNVTRSCTET